MSSPKADDFTRIKGIGPAIEKRLHNAGIRTFARLSALSPAEVAALTPGLSAERITQQGWTRQARKLAPKQVPAKPRKETAALVGRQHYATFTVELLLDENDEARRTRVVHIQSGDMDTWAGWEAEQLIDFLARHTAARSRLAKPVPLAVAPKPIQQAPASPEPVQPVEAVAESVPQVVPTAARPAPLVIATPEPVPEVIAATKSAPSPSTLSGLAGVLRLRGLEVIPTNMNEPQSTLSREQAFEVRLKLDLTKVTMPSNPLLDYKASVYTKSMSGGSRQTVGEAQGIVEFAESLDLIVNGTALPRGFYRLEAAVILTPISGQSWPPSDLKAWLEGGLLQVY